MLTSADLTALEERLRSAGVRFDEWTQPGLGADEIQERLVGPGLRLPDEAVTWWSWRNGETRDGWGKVLPQWRRFASLEDAIRVYRDALTTAADIAPEFPSEDPDELWQANWFPVTDDRTKLVLDCSVGPGDASPVRSHNWEDTRAEHEAIRAASFGDVVALWRDAIDTGVWEWDAAAERWRPHWDRLDDRALWALT